MADKVLAGQAPRFRRRHPTLPFAGPARGRLARQSRTRKETRQRHLFQRQPSHQSDQRLRGALQAVCVRPRPRLAGRLHLRPRRNYQRAEQGVREGATEFHIVGGLHPDLPFEYFLEMIRGLKQRCPGVHLKAFTMVEVHYFSRIAKISIEETLRRMKEAGVDSCPGGGAEIFHPRVRRIICDHKVSGQVWLNTAKKPTRSVCLQTPPCFTATWKPKKNASIIS